MCTIWIQNAIKSIPVWTYISNMKRRHLLGVIGVSPIAMFSASRINFSTKSHPDISIETDDIPSESSISIDGTVLEQFSRNAPARIDITVENTDTEPDTYLFDSPPPFSEYSSKDSPTMVIIPDSLNGPKDGESTPSSYIPDSPKGNCWKATSELISSHATRFVELGPGESINRSYTLLASASSKRCLPPDEYRFEPRDPTSVGFEWGFSILVE